MKLFQENKSVFSITRSGELSLSGTAFTELLQAVVSKEASFRFQVKGFSMSPFIKDGDVVTISPLVNAEPCFGDVVAFLHPDTKRLIIHRVVGGKGDSYLMRGDNAFEMDGLVSKENILGRLKKVERNRRELLIGLGPERVLIAFLSRRKLLSPILLLSWRLIRPFAKRWIL